MTQQAQPIEDISTGGWQPTPIYSEIDGLAPDDGSEVTSSADGDSFVCRLGPILEPDEGSQTLTVRLKREGSDKLEAKVELLQGDTSIAHTTVRPGTSYGDVTLELSQEEIDQITDYTDLRVRVTAKMGPNVPCCDHLPSTLRLTNIDEPGSECDGWSVTLSYQEDLSSDIHSVWIGETGIGGVNVKFQVKLACTGPSFEDPGDWEVTNLNSEEAQNVCCLMADWEAHKDEWCPGCDGDCDNPDCIGCIFHHGLLEGEVDCSEAGIECCGDPLNVDLTLGAFTCVLTE